ncbi:uncharacterized protein LOC107264933 isoform X2 [Cephus cinctus]|uniref:Uncharacterized protein LOC107264933 isoform X2 n=1 Tax=Cephus cinctus TaxID=211228 RepID=A0AAJ7BLR1_CEPCN|nr:uncharacterized protein LOC107264933 isoform X2 [Cephus cinctus]
MFTRKIVLLLALMRIWNASLVHSFLEEGLLAKSIGPWVTYSNLRTVQLLNQLCNDSQDESSVERDACYGCFFRASNQASGYPMLLAMSNCADIYLNNTDYGHCQRYIRNATNSASSRTSPNTIYCTFLECVRQVNKDMLDAREIKRQEGFVLGRRILRPRRVLCVVRDFNEGSTKRPGAEPVDPRDPR